MAQQVLNTGKTARAQLPTQPDSGSLKPGQPGGSFSDVLQKTLQQEDGLRFSAHAMKRLDDRNIELSLNEMQRLSEGVKRVEEKGGRNSLIMIDDRAFLVSVPNRTVVTAMPKDSSMGNVFTNIDSVLIN